MSRSGKWASEVYICVKPQNSDSLLQGRVFNLSKFNRFLFCKQILWEDNINAAPLNITKHRWTCRQNIRSQN